MVLVVMASQSVAATTPELQNMMRASTFEVVMKKPEKDPLSYEKPLPLELLPYMERTDAYRSIGTAFSLGNNVYVTAGHVLEAGIGSQYGIPALRDADGKVYVIDQISKFSAHEDFVVFSVTGNPAKEGLAVNRSPQINTPVFAVGNALGEGVVIRDGLYTSNTPEEQDGRWKWMRFSAPASPGNSGGPLLDATGAVIGIVIGKSPNENLNYSLQISNVLDATAKKAQFDMRYTQPLSFLHGTLTHTLKTEFALPKTWNAFAASYADTIDHDAEQARLDLLAKHTVTYFPAGADGVLYSNEHDYNPRLLAQQSDDLWKSEAIYFDTKELPGDGFVNTGSALGLKVFRIHRPDDAADAAFYSNSKAFMDLALNGLNITRQVGSDSVRITSLGAAIRDEKYTDKYGRIWQRRVWPIPYLDMYAIAMLLPTPDGYVGFMQYSPSFYLHGMVSTFEHFTNLIDVSYFGTVTQWQAYLARKDLLPKPLRDTQLSRTGENTVLNFKTGRFVIALPPNILQTTNSSLVGLHMSYLKTQSGVTWEASGLQCYQDVQKRTYVVLNRHAMPPPTIKHELRDNWDNLVSRRSPYDGTITHESADTFSASTVIAVPGTDVGKVSNDLSYSLTVGVETYFSHDEMNSRLELARTGVTIEEHGNGNATDTELDAQSESAHLNSLKIEFKELESLLVNISKGNSPQMESKTRDLRDRTFADDIHDYLVPPVDLDLAKSIRIAFDSAVNARNVSNAETQLRSLQSLNDAMKARFITISKYWSAVSEIEQQRQMWRVALDHDHLPADTPHNSTVVETEKKLNSPVTKSGPLGDDWTPLVSQLNAALLQERNNLARKIGQDHTHDPFINYQPRNSPCTQPSLENNINPVKKYDGTTEKPIAITTVTNAPPDPKTTIRARLVQPLPNPDDFYPAASKRNTEEGVVVISMHIDTDGCPINGGIAASSGSDALDAAALQFYEKLRYWPATLNSKPVATTQELAITFRLSL